MWTIIRIYYSLLANKKRATYFFRCFLFWGTILHIILRVIFPEKFVDTSRMNEKEKFEHLTGVPYDVIERLGIDKKVLEKDQNKQEKNQ